MFRKIRQQQVLIEKSLAVLTMTMAKTATVITMRSTITILTMITMITMIKTITTLMKRVGNYEGSNFLQALVLFTAHFVRSCITCTTF